MGQETVYVRRASETKLTTLKQLGYKTSDIMELGIHYAHLMYVANEDEIKTEIKQTEKKRKFLNTLLGNIK